MAERPLHFANGMLYGTKPMITTWANADLTYFALYQNSWMKDPRYKDGYLDKVQSWINVTENAVDESDKNL